MKRNTIKFFSMLAISVVIFNCYAYTTDQSNKLSAKERAQGWKLLFDGRSVTGWHQYNSQAPFTRWKAKDGQLFCDPLDKAGVGDLITDQEYKNFDLKFEWKLPKGGNSGVFINVLEKKEIPTAWASGPEYQLLDDANPDFAKPQSRSGCLYGFAPQKNKVKSKPSDAWNHSEIKQKNGKVQFYLNGVLTAEEDFTSKKWADKVANSHFKGFPEFGKHISGHIALQDWATGISFRNIKIREL
ncbi:DUF1080 domain-containing protein [Mucilaginibacter sp. HC2]|uniref:3-keto-disaccharide hydrolase n=1 Tax=Mucilaginibacter inviolabilis TaxID=2714892 RepID=UPI001407C449|nr:DUF1080 domain-containing protein [Mucilaginibacter inviolabilis]NHA03690.1 DUF1080 domain-containing protein [Mucilaginibacter inviolabilis]